MKQANKKNLPVSATWTAFEAERDVLIAKHMAEVNALIGQTIKWSFLSEPAVVVAVGYGCRYRRSEDFNPDTLHVESASGVRDTVPFDNYKTFKKYNP